MPFYCGKRSAGTASFSAGNSPGRLTISAARTNMVRLFVAPCALNYSLGKSGFDALGVGGRNSYASDSFEPAASHLPASPFPRTKDDSDRLLGQGALRLWRRLLLFLKRLRLRISIVKLLP